MSEQFGADDLTLPIKRTDGETIEERLTGNAYHNILPARYLRKNGDGELVEQQEDLFERVARNIALAEAVFEARKQDVEVRVTPDQIKPDHPRRDELAAEVFGAGVGVGDDVERPLTEHNVNKFAYETVVPELPEAIRDHVETTAAEFQEAMERLSFMPNCVPPDSLVAASGGLKPISGVEPGERVYDDEDGAARVEHKYDNGEKRVVEIETESGYTVRATPEHYFRVITADGRYEWEQVKNIESTDTLAVQKNFLDDDGESPSLDWQPTTTDGGAVQAGRSRGQFQPPTVMTAELAEWLGLYIGDGTARDSSVRVAFDDSDPDLLDHWVELTESVFGFEPTAGPHHSGACLVGRASRRDLSDFLDQNDLLKTNSRTATVPASVLRSGRSGVAAFLRGLFEADGTVGDRQIELYTHSEQLGRQVQKLLLGLGIRSRLSEKRDGYRLSIRKNVCGKRFVDRVGFLSERKRERAARFTDVAENATSIKIPNQTERLRDWWQESELGLDAYQDLSQFLIDPDSEYHQDIGKGIFERYAEVYPELWDSPVAELVERDQFYERVERVTEVGTMAVEDMRVPRRNTYVVEGFVSHNSPTLMNAGDELQQLSACFVDSPADDIDDIHQTAKEAAQVFQCLTEDATVWAEQEGLVSVSEVEAGDSVAQRTDSGFQYGRVEETHTYEDAETLTVRLANGLTVRGTPNHRLLVDGDWTRLDEVRAGQEMHYALGWLREMNPDTPELAPVSGDATRGADSSASFDGSVAPELSRDGQADAETAVSGVESGAVVTDSRARVSAKLDSGRTDSTGSAVETVQHPGQLTDALAELVGLWVGGGSCDRDSVRFRVERESVAEYIDQLSRQLFGTSATSSPVDDCYEVVIDGHEIGQWWTVNFDSRPEDAGSVRVPRVVRSAPASAVESFLRGYFTADGALLDGTDPKLYSSSERAIEDVATLMMGLGYPVEKSVSRDEDAGPEFGLTPTTEAGRRAFLRDVGFVDERREIALSNTGSGIPRDSRVTGEGHTVEVEAVVESDPATVYDLTVEDTHEYVADGIVSHNSGGGMGYAFWRLRPYGDPVGSTGGIASGPVTFMRTYDQMCFPPGTGVLTPDGYQPIEDIRQGDVVIDETGERQPVTETMERRVTEEIVEIVPERLNKPIRATGEHPFKVVRDDGCEWVEADNLETDDLLVLGHATDDNDLELGGQVDITNIASGPLVFSDGGVTVNREYYRTKKGTNPQAFADKVPVEAFATLAGWYLAEGCVVYRRGIPGEVTFTLHSDERDAADDIQRALDAFGVSSRIETVEDRNTQHIHVEHTSFAQFINSLFGTGASEKQVPDVLWNAPPETQARVLETLFAGDGRLETRGRSQRVQLKLVNEEIIDFVFQAGLRCGVQFSRHDRTPDDRQPTYSVSASVSSALETPLECLFNDVDDEFAPRDRTKQRHGHEVVAIDSVEQLDYEGPVYNAEVAETHSYVAEDVVVHNCETIAQGGARRGAQMGVMRVSHPDVIQFIHAKNKDVSLANTLRLNDPDDFTHTSFADALEEARELIDDGQVPKHLRNAVEGHLSNFNISVGITNDFMEAVKNDEAYTFTNPRTGEPHVATAETVELYEMFGLGEHVETGEVLSVPARELWEHIIEGAHENGEPGVVYLERINEEHSFDVEEHPDHRILSTNPSLAAGTKVLTDQGVVGIEELEGDRFEVPTLSGEWADAVCHQSGTNEPLYEVELSNGKSYRATAEHKWPVLKDGSYERTKTTEIETGDRLPIGRRDRLQYGSEGTYDEGTLVGWLYGHGNVTERKDGRTQYGFTFSQADADSGMMDRILDTLAELTGVEYDPTERQRGGEPWYEVHASNADIRQFMSRFGVGPKEDGVPDALWRDASESFRKGFVDGLFSADGQIDPEQNRIVLVSSRETLVDDVSDLLGFYGLKTSIRESKREHWGETHERWELNLSQVQADRFRQVFELSHESKAASLRELETPDRESLLSDNVVVEAVRETSERGPVWDLRVDERTHTFALSQAFTGNCGEQPLEEYEACNLGHINLSTLAAEDAPDWRVWSGRHAGEYATREAAVEAFLEEAIDREEFDRRIELGTQFLEDVVTMSDFPVDEIEKTVREMRKIGLGIMGLAQLNIQLGVKYGSDAANEIARQLMVHINNHSKWTSHELAEERGTFAEWDNSKYADPTEYREWFEHQTGLDADDWKDGFPIRNHNTTTIAPTGCVEENSLVSTDDGLVPIKELDETTAEFEQWDDIEVGVSTDGGTEAATAVYDNGFAEVRRIETEGGFSVAATPEHRFRTISDDGEYAWRTADEFSPGDRILLQRNSFEAGTRSALDVSESENYHWNSEESLHLPEEMTPELAEFLGYFMGDGYVHEDVGVKLVVESDADELDTYLRELGESLFGVSPTVEDRDTRHVLVFGGRHLPRYFEDNGWTKDGGNRGEGAASARVPEEVLAGTEPITKAFLRGLFEADGTASRKIELSTVSSTLADQVQTVLLSLGCVFVQDSLEMEEVDDHYGDRTRYSVRGANKREDVRFLEEVGFLTKSTEFELTAQSHRNDTYPPAVVDAIRSTNGYRSVSDSVRKRVNQSPINGSVSRKLVQDVENETGERVRLDGRTLTEFYAATVESVTETTAYTKDISVPSNNTYIANGFVTHNTTSMVGNTTGGCEPIYNVAYYKNVSDDVQGDEMLVEFDDYFLRVLEANGIDVETVKEEATSQMAENRFDGVDGLSTVPDAIGELFVTTGDLSAKQHASVQCACQNGVDSAISKCLNEGTLVQTDSGVRPIESFGGESAESGEFVDVSEDVTIDGVQVESQYYAGEKSATRVRVDNGTELVGATESHTVLTPDGWQVLGELEEGDYVIGRYTESHGEGGTEIAFSRGGVTVSDGGDVLPASGAEPSVHEKDVTLPGQMTPRLARFLGMYAADGSAIDGRYSIEISTASERVRDEVYDLFESLFGRTPSIDEDTRHGEQRDTVYGVHLNSKPVWEFVTALCGSGAYEKEIPREILQGSSEEKLAFVNGATLDGYVTGQSLVVYGGMSECLATGIAELLRSFGVPKVYLGRKWVDESDAYAYNVHATNDAQELVTPVEPHKRVDRFEQRHRVYVPQRRVDKTEFDSRSQEYYAARSFEHRGNNYMFNTTAESLGITDAPPLHEVTAVEDAGTREMYDIELAGPHEYVVGGVVSHNTVNAPNSSTVEDAKEVFEYIYDNGGKGVTYYRDGTRSKQVLTTRAQNTEFAEMDEEEAIEFIVEQIDELFGGIEGFLESEEIRERLSADIEALLAEESRRHAEKKPRPDQLHGVTQRIETGYGKLYVTINEDPETGEPFELFANTGHSGGFTNSFTDALAKTISVALRSGVDPDEIVDKLQGIRSPKVAWDKGEQVNSIPDAFGTALRRYLDDEIDTAYPDQATLEETAAERDGDGQTGRAPPETDGAGGVRDAASIESDHQSVVDAGENPECPNCGSLSLYYSEGCKTCESCGWSEC